MGSQGQQNTRANGDCCIFRSMHNNSFAPDGKPIVMSCQDEVDAFESTARKFLADILEMSFDSVLLTDLSSLSDFCPNGVDDATFTPEMSWSQVRKAWTPQIIEKVRERYGIADVDVDEPLVALFRRIEAAEAAPVLQ